MGEKIAIVLVNYNGKKYLKKCVDDILNQTYKNISIVVVDNASNDNSLMDLEESERLIVIRRQENEGFARGCNIGIRYALKHKADYVMLLNIDTEISENMVELLHHCADVETVTTPKIYYATERNKIWCAGGYIDYTNGKHIQFHNGREPQRTNNIVKFVSGCCMLAHKDIWKKNGLLDENFFMYYDDDDYSVRLGKKGIKIKYVPDAIMWHKVGGCHKGQRNHLTEYYFTRNRLYFVHKHRDVMKIDVISLTVQILWRDVIWASGEDKKFVREKWRGIKDFYLKKMDKAQYEF